MGNGHGALRDAEGGMGPDCGETASRNGGIGTICLQCEGDEKQPPQSAGHAGGVRFVLRILMPACIVHWADMVLECGTCHHEWPRGALRTRIVVRAGLPLHERRGR
jgi:hypothetical protein